MGSLKDYFKPEFINRLDEIVVFDVLPREAILDIVKIQIKLVAERLSQKEISLVVTSDALRYLAKEGYNPQYGARPLKRIIQTKILNPVASLIIGKGLVKGGSVEVGLKKNELTFDIKKGRKGSLFQEEMIIGKEKAGVK